MATVDMKEYNESVEAYKKWANIKQTEINKLNQGLITQRKDLILQIQTLQKYIKQLEEKAKSPELDQVKLKEVRDKIAVFQQNLLDAQYFAKTKNISLEERDEPSISESYDTIVIQPVDMISEKAIPLTFWQKFSNVFLSIASIFGFDLTYKPKLVKDIEPYQAHIERKVNDLKQTLSTSLTVVNQLKNAEQQAKTFLTSLGVTETPPIRSVVDARQGNLEADQDVREVESANLYQRKPLPAGESLKKEGFAAVSDTPSAPTPVASSVSETPSTPIPPATVVPAAPEAPKAPEAAEISEVMSAPNAPETPSTPIQPATVVPAAPEAPKAPEAAEISEVVSALNAPKTPSTPIPPATVVPAAPEAPKAPKAAEIPEVVSAPSALETLSTPIPPAAETPRTPKASEISKVINAPRAPAAPSTPTPVTPTEKATPQSEETLSKLLAIRRGQLVGNDGDEEDDQEQENFKSPIEPEIRSSGNISPAPEESQSPSPKSATRDLEPKAKVTPKSPIKFSSPSSDSSDRDALLRQIENAPPLKPIRTPQSPKNESTEGSLGGIIGKLQANFALQEHMKNQKHMKNFDSHSSSEDESPNSSPSNKQGSK